MRYVWPDRDRLTRSICTVDPTPPSFCLLPSLLSPRLLFLSFFSRLMPPRRAIPLFWPISRQSVPGRRHGVVMPASVASNISINNVIAGRWNRACVQQPLARGIHCAREGLGGEGRQPSRRTVHLCAFTRVMGGISATRGQTRANRWTRMCGVKWEGKKGSLRTFNARGDGAEHFLLFVERGG